MNRKDFGRLVAVLRQEQGWTQAQLAAFMNVDEDMLSNIERGAKKHIDPDLLYRFANVFQLTSLERREFFLAASGLEPQQMLRGSDGAWAGETSAPEVILSRLLDLISRLTVPALITDVYGDIVAINPAIFHLYDVNDAMLQAAATSPFGFNFIYFLYGMATQNPAFGQNFSDSAYQFLRAFREGTLRYRIYPRFIELMKEMRNVQKYPLFDRHWRNVSLMETDKESEVNSYVIHHPRYGALSVITTASVTITPYGELYLSHYIPVNRETAAAFLDMYDQVGGGVMRLSPWPRVD